MTRRDLTLARIPLAAMVLWLSCGPALQHEDLARGPDLLVADLAPFVPDLRQCPATDTVDHCGACGNACSRNHITPICAAGGCDTGACEPAWADCNKDKRADGCESFIKGDPKNCGACGVVCSANNLEVACANGQCGGACAAGFLDCNNNKQLDGCEVQSDKDAKHCGGCGKACSTSHVTPACAGGTCQAGACDVNYADCNNDKRADGCEVNTQSDGGNCGGCGKACSNRNIAASCVGGACAGTCNPGYADCNNDKRADGCEVELATDVKNCGACNNDCTQGGTVSMVQCVAGACKLNGCATGRADCNMNAGDGCEISIATDPQRCGGCVGSACSTTNIVAQCQMGSCESGACISGFLDCDGNKRVNGCEVNSLTSLLNCGGCGQACSTNNLALPACSMGSCEGATCAAGFADCNNSKRVDGCEINIRTNVSHCGGCGRSCSTNNVPTPQCSGAGVCTGACATGYGDCDGDKLSNGCEVNLGSDVQNCGGCGVVCSADNISRACAGGSCQSGLCAAGYADCNSNKRTDGCEVNVSGDVQNCGGCGTACSVNNIINRVCVGGSCQAGVCATGFGDCNNDKRTDGCEVSLQTSVNHCGACGAACSSNHVTATCAFGSCQMGPCEAGYSDCNNDKRTDGCETRGYCNLSFGARLHYTAGTQLAAITTGDFDRDGYQDLALGGADLTTLRNGGIFGFGAPVALGIGGTTGVLALDYDGNGWLDLASVGNGATRLTPAVGGGLFGATTATPSTSVPNSLAAGDLNGDGRIDLVIGQALGDVLVRRGLAGGGLDVATSWPISGSNSYRVVIEDFTRDGHLDVCYLSASFAMASGNTLGVMQGNGGGGFGGLVITTALPSQYFRLAAGDFNNDGKKDVVVANSVELRVLMGDGGGRFTLAATHALSNTSGIGVADLNKDGLLDLILSNGTSTNLSVLLGQAGGAFAAPRTFDAGFSTSALVVVDQDNDGRLDLIATESAGTRIAVLTNTSR